MPLSARGPSEFWRRDPNRQCALTAMTLAERRRVPGSQDGWWRAKSAATRGARDHRKILKR